MQNGSMCIGPCTHEPEVIKQAALMLQSNKDDTEHCSERSMFYILHFVVQQSNNADSDPSYIYKVGPSTVQQ